MVKWSECCMRDFNNEKLEVKEVLKSGSISLNIEVRVFLMQYKIEGILPE